MSAEKEPIPGAKIVLVGASATGAKTSLAIRFVKGVFDCEVCATIGAQYLRKVVEVDGIRMKLEIWDTAGQERYRSLTPMYYRNAQAVIVGFDVTERYTFEGCDSWIQELRANAPDCVVVAVGNKIDLVDSRDVSKEEAHAHFETMNPPVPYFETSAKTGEGVNELFDAVTRMIIERNAFTVNNNENIEESGMRTSKGEKCIIC